jgi:rod shape-determining protein MreD
MARPEPRRRIDHAPTQVQLTGIPIVSVMLASLLPLVPMIAPMPLLPPLGFMVLVAWRLLHRTMWAPWLPLPLGLFDDMFSGQPIGSAMLLWTLAFFALDLFDRRMMWRDSVQDWGLASFLIVAQLLGALWIANHSGASTSALVLFPQILVSILLFPAIARLCALLDRIRQSA